MHDEFTALHISLSTISNFNLCIRSGGFTCWTPRTTQELVTRNPLTFFFFFQLLFFSSFSHFQDSCYSLGEWVGYIGIAEREKEGDLSIGYGTTLLRIRCLCFTFLLVSLFWCLITI